MIQFQKYKASLLSFIITFVILVICFIALYCYCIYQSGVLHTYVFTEDNLNIPQDGLSLSVTVTKQWIDESLHPDIPAGAQYDGILKNGSEITFKNWKAELIFSGNLKIDSSWNGLFMSSGKRLTFVAEGNPATVLPHSTSTFGAVLYAVNLMSLKSYTLKGYRLICMQKLPVFRAAAALFVLWCIILIIYTAIQLRTAAYRKRQELDSRIIVQSMNTLTSFIDAKDTYTKGHSTRVAEYAAEMARCMKIDHNEVTQIYYIALMHDCGKISIPDAVLKKNGRLTDEEYSVIKSHTVIGGEMLQNFTAIPGIRDGALYHHERFDGKGYPSGLAGFQIPLCARIICIADSFDAMSSNRCYRRSLPLKVILKELEQNAGRQFDPAFVPVMIKLIENGFVNKTQEKYPIIDYN
ncbi:MAG: HD domain-containing protein [Treponema sp.]|nr:HD domain-containing protein [Treponema sp.]